MELGRRNHLRQLLHVGRFDVNNIEALVLNLQIPQVDPEIIRADERLSIAVDRDAVDMVGVCVGIGLAWNGGDDGVVMSKSRHLQRRRRGEVDVGFLARWTTPAHRPAGRQIARQIVLRYHPQHLLVHLP